MHSCRLLLQLLQTMAKNIEVFILRVFVVRNGFLVLEGFSVDGKSSGPAHLYHEYLKVEVSPHL